MDIDPVLKSFQPQGKLNPLFWPGEGSQLNPRIRKVLLKTAKQFITDWGLHKKMKIHDIRLTGSLANYNWSKYSDVDLHIVVEYSDLNKDEALVEKLFALLKARWNDIHDIKINGYEIEVYVEDNDEKHIATGLYSVLRDAWIKEPEQATAEVDEDDIVTKVRYFFRLYEALVDKFSKGDYEFVIKTITKTKDKIKKMRQVGLEREGEFSTENLAFKVLRRTELLQKYNELFIKATDKGLLEKKGVANVR